MVNNSRRARLRVWTTRAMGCVRYFDMVHWTGQCGVVSGMMSTPVAKDWLDVHIFVTVSVSSSLV